MKAKAIFDPPEQLRVGPLKKGAFESALRSTRLAALLGVMLGVTFSVCFFSPGSSHM
ncbi:MAG: hypothetical protein H0V97_05390 [Actinobacteria bacterium]|nr:hypothetical protein [Actinomycetota bacterium]